jgi:hypothetical protein
MKWKKFKYPKLLNGRKEVTYQTHHHGTIWNIYVMNFIFITYMPPYAVFYCPLQKMEANDNSIYSNSSSQYTAHHLRGGEGVGINSKTHKENPYILQFLRSFHTNAWLVLLWKLKLVYTIYILKNEKPQSLVCITNGTNKYMPKGLVDLEYGSSCKYM